VCTSDGISASRQHWPVNVFVSGIAKFYRSLGLGIFGKLAVIGLMLTCFGTALCLVSELTSVTTRDCLCSGYFHAYIHIYIRTYIHTYIHTYVRTYINTHTNRTYVKSHKEQQRRKVQ
jgi:hypothetical protein